MLLPVLQVFLGNGCGFDDHDVFGIAFFGSTGEVVAARDNHLAIDNHDLVMSDSVAVVDERWDTGMRGVVGR